MPGRGLRKSVFCCIPGGSSEAPEEGPNARPFAGSSHELNERPAATPTGNSTPVSTTMDVKELDPAATATPAKKPSPAVEPVWFVKYGGTPSSDEKKITSHELRSAYLTSPSNVGSSSGDQRDAEHSGGDHSCSGGNGY